MRMLSKTQINKKQKTTMSKKLQKIKPSGIYLCVCWAIIWLMCVLQLAGGGAAWSAPAGQGRHRLPICSEAFQYLI